MPDTRRGAPLYANPGMQRLLALVEELGPDAHETARALVLTGFSFHRAASMSLFGVPVAPTGKGLVVERMAQTLRQRVHRWTERVDRMLAGAGELNGRARGATRVKVSSGADGRAYEWAAAASEEDEA